ncbi:MAG: hypothetical protein U0325_11270 [Polyangiales bacterium]
MSFFTIPFFQSCIFCESMVTPETFTPITDDCVRARSAKFAAAMSAFDGMQPQLRHTPPQDSFSITRVFCLSCARRMPAT